MDVTLNGSSATASGDGVTVDGSTITVTSAGTYRLTGSLTGQVIIKADSQDVKLILNGVELTNPSGSPMVVTAADEVTLILADGTDNTVSDATTYANTSSEAPSSAIDSASDLSIAGSGSLTVTGNNNDAINSADGLVITGGTVTIDSKGDGLDSNAAGTISGGSVVVLGPTMGRNGSIDVQSGLTVTGGELWAIGASGMAESPSESSTQAFVFTNLNGSTTGEVSIADSNGNVIATQTSSKQYSSVLYSGSSISADGTYEILLDGKSAGTVSANQYATGMGGAQPGPGQQNSRPGR